MKLKNTIIITASCALMSFNVLGANSAPKNLYLADSVYPIAHGNAAQQDSLDVAGPREASRILSEDEKFYTHLGPMHYGTLISNIYNNGKRVLWSNGADRIVKYDQETNELIDVLYPSGKEEYSENFANKTIEELNNIEGVAGLKYSLSLSQKMFKNLAGVYTLMDKDNNYYMGNNTGIVVYGDAQPGVANSKIVKLREFKTPDFVTGSYVGMNLTFDGKIVIATEHGYVLVIERDFSSYKSIKMKFSENANTDTTAGRGWVRNAIALDKNNGIYIVSKNHMHKVVWTGTELSVDEKDGAFAVPYSNTGKGGSGSTPSLMGFSEEDKFVVITDGDHLMNLTLIWRDEIPSDWKGLPGEDRRIAAKTPVDMGDAMRIALQSEQSVVISGYGVAVVNNEARNQFDKLPSQMNSLIIGMMGNSPVHQPYGVQKMEWNPQARELEYSWVNKTVSSPNAMPIVSKGSDAFYTIGARDSKWTIEGIDWSTGEEIFNYVVGDQRYNSLYSGVMLDQNGDLMYGTIFGRVRIRLQ